MSVFGPKDENLPALTQIYQLEIEPNKLYHGDLDRWLAKTLHKEYPGLEYWSDVRSPVPIEHESMVGGRDDTMGEDEKNLIRGLHQSMVDNWAWHANAGMRTDLHWSIVTIGVVKQMMDSLADEGIIHEADAAEFLKLAKTFNTEPAHEWDADEQGRITPQSFRLVRFSPSVMPLEWQIIDMMERAIFEAQKTPDYFRRCTVCNNVFLAGRADARVCSHRCHVRQSARLRRARKKKQPTRNNLFWYTDKVYTMVATVVNYQHRKDNREKADHYGITDSRLGDDQQRQLRSS